MGLFMLIGSILNSDFLLTGIKENRLAKLIGRLGVRILYGVLGFLLTVIGIMMFFVNVDMLFE